jgi:hypothetical protein
MNALLHKLDGGDRRSIGRSGQVVAEVLADPDLFEVVFAGMSATNPLVCMRCADAVEKITAQRPEFLGAYKARLLKLAATAGQQEVRWHIAQLVSRVEWKRAERRKVAAILSEYLADASKIVKTFAMQALADIAAQDAELRAPIVQRLEKLTRVGSPAMKARGRKLLARLKQAERGGRSDAGKGGERC